MNTREKVFTVRKTMMVTPEQSEFLNGVIAPEYHGGYAEFIRTLINKEMALRAT